MFEVILFNSTFFPAPKTFEMSSEHEAPVGWVQDREQRAGRERGSLG